MGHDTATTATTGTMATGATARYLTSGQAAARLDISAKTLLRAARRGDIVPAHYTPGGCARFRPADVEAFARRLARGHAARLPVEDENRDRNGDRNGYVR